MQNISAPEPSGIDKSAHKEDHAIQFPLDDATILQHPSNCPCNWFNWTALKDLRSALKLGQIVAAIVILALTQLRTRDHIQIFPEIPFIFFTINAMVLTMLLLGDMILTSRPLRRAFTPVLWFQIELWFTGVAALVYHVLAYLVLIMTYDYYHVQVNRVASAFGFISAGLYLVDWWTNFRKRHEIVQEMYGEVEGGNNQGSKI